MSFKFGLFCIEANFQLHIVSLQPKIVLVLCSGSIFLVYYFFYWYYIIKPWGDMETRQATSCPAAQRVHVECSYWLRVVYHSAFSALPAAVSAWPPSSHKQLLVGQECRTSLSSIFLLTCVCIQSFLSDIWSASRKKRHADSKICFSLHLCWVFTPCWHSSSCLFGNKWKKDTAAQKINLVDSYHYYIYFLLFLITINVSQHYRFHRLN